MPAVRKDDFAIFTAVSAVVVEDGTYLRDHRLGRVHICSRPAMDSAQLSEETNIEQ